MAVADYPSKFLSLPRELRDVIYAYALTSPDGLYYYRDEEEKVNLCPSKDTTTGFNQLKYVCRLLYSETVCLELRYNDLTFVLAPDREGEYVEQQPAVQLLDFLDLCHERWQYRLPHLYLRNLYPPMEALQMLEESGPCDLHLIEEWCKTHPTTNVFWELPVLNALSGQDDPLSFTMGGLMMRLAYRGFADFDKLCKGIERYLIWSTLRMYLALWQVGRKIPLHSSESKRIEATNFRVIPPDGPFRENDFRMGIDVEVRRWAAIHEPPSSANIETWIHLARDWYAHGI